jgi:hypothetical protein
MVHTYQNLLHLVAKSELWCYNFSVEKQIAIYFSNYLINCLHIPSHLLLKAIITTD